MLLRAKVCQLTCSIPYVTNTSQSVVVGPLIDWVDDIAVAITLAGQCCYF